MIEGESPFMTKERINSLDLKTKAELIEYYRMGRYSTLLNIAKGYNITTGYLYNCIRDWIHEDLIFSTKPYNFEVDVKDLSFSERLNLAKNMESIKEKLAQVKNS